MSVYAASKAFVLSFSEALHEENHSHGVIITALCPGPRDSEFARAANMQQSQLFNFPLLRPLSSAYIAKQGITSLLRGQRVIVPGLRNKFLKLFSVLAPTILNLRITKSFTQYRQLRPR